MPLLAPLIAFLPEIAAAALALAFLIAAALVGGYVTEQIDKYLPSFISGFVDSLPNAIENGLNAVAAAIFGSDIERLANLFNGLAASFQALIDYPAALWKGVHAAFVYLWDTALPQAIGLAVNPVRTLANEAKALAGQAESDIATAFDEAQAYTDSKVAGAVADLRAYAEQQASGALHTAEGYADTAVGKLAATEDAAVAAATSLARTAEADAAAAYTNAVAYVDGIVKPVETGLSDFEKYVNSLGLAGLVAALPALALLVQTIASESGLDNAACRSKVKGICGTSPAAWENLLAGIAAFGLAFDLADIVSAAVAILGTAENLIAQVGAVAESDIESVGKIVGQAALAIAA